MRTLQPFYTDLRYIDVIKVDSVNGTYIANYMDDDGEKTVITYDKGAFWWGLTMADAAADGSSGNVHLTMERLLSQFGMPAPVSTPSATGVILANGYVGDTVPQTMTGLKMASTFLSEDGGRCYTRACIA
jgi:hypothetical protein